MDDDGVVINHQDLSNQLPPDVSITTPSTDPFVTQHENINAKALLLRVDNRSDVTVKLNNKNITNFSFDPKMEHSVWNPTEPYGQHHKEA